MSRRLRVFRPAAVTLAAATWAALAAAQSAPQQVGRVEVNGRAQPETDGAKLTVTKKVSVAKLEDQPAVVDGNQREIFNALPGLVLAEQADPSQLNLSYRGIGNPQESEFLLVLQDGIPIASDFLAFPTLHVTPVPQSVREVQMIRGGSGLLYGPQPQPVLNYITKRPTPGQPLTGSTEQVGGSDHLFASYNTLSGSSGAIDWGGRFAYRSSDGQRANGDYRTRNGALSVGFTPAAGQHLALNVDSIRTESGLPGLLTIAQFQANPQTTTTPNDRTWVDRDTVSLVAELHLGADWLVEAKAWNGRQRLTTRSVSGATATTLADLVFDYTGLDARALKPWGGHALAFGYTGYSSQSPWRQYSGSNPTVSRDETSQTLSYANDRHTRYDAMFAENAFRFDGLHIVPAVRLEREEIAAHETVATGHPTNLANRSLVRNKTLRGLGLGQAFAGTHEAYLNLSQGWRPVRYLEIASATRSFGATNAPESTSYTSFEFGAQGRTAAGFAYNVSLFQVNAKNKIESQGNGIAGQTVSVNSGDARSRGLEGQWSYDLFRQLGERPAGQALNWTFNASLLDAKITRSQTLVSAGGPTLAGNRLAYAPRHVVKTGLTWRDGNAFKAALLLTSVGEQYWADNNQPRVVSGVEVTPAKIRAVSLADLSFDWTVVPHVRLLGGVSNLTDRRYYSRVFFVNGGIEPAKGRTVQIGAAFDL